MRDPKRIRLFSDGLTVRKFLSDLPSLYSDNAEHLLSLMCTKRLIQRTTFAACASGLNLPGMLGATSIRWPGGGLKRRHAVDARSNLNLPLQPTSGAESTA